MNSSDKTPDKYIRTFASDMEILKKGGRPELKPLNPSSSTIPVSTPVKAPAPVPTPAPIVIPPIPVPIPTPIPVPSPLPEKPEASVSSPIETYESDFTARVKEGSASTATILAAEQDAKTGEPSAPAQTVRTSILPILAGVVLLVLGAAGAYIAYTRYAVKIAPIVLAPIVSTPIFVDEREQIAGKTALTLLQSLEQSLTKPLANNAVRLLYTAESSTTDQSVFSALQFPAPGVLLRNINPSQSMAGVISIEGTETPFFILSVTAYNETFAGMLAWEPLMARDMSILFPPHPEVAHTAVVASTTATTTSAKLPTKKSATVAQATTTPLFVPLFHDEVVSNHDVRVYRDAAGRSVLLYGYWNQKTLVIARDQAAFIEILGRLATSHTP